MIQELFDRNIFIYIMLALLASGILLKLIMTIVYSNLVKASDSMATSKNKLTQTMKKKFETCYKLKIGVNNVDIFVDKYVFRHRFCGILLSTWESICGQLLILCLLVGSISTILGLIYECGKQQILGTFSVGILSSGMLIFLEGLINLSGKKEIIRLNMKDYLENILKVRLEQESIQPEFLEEYKNKYLKEELGQALESPSLLAAATENSSKQPRRERKRLKKLEKARKKRMRIGSKESRRLEKINRKARLKADAKKRVEDKKFAKMKKKADKLEQKKLAKEEKERIKNETKLVLEQKREAERAEMERIRMAAKLEEKERKEEKLRQAEIKKTLQLEKQVVRQEKKKPQSAEKKTVAQERKEVLLKEIKQRRTMNDQEEEKEVVIELNDASEDKIAATLVKESEKTELEAPQKLVEMDEDIDKKKIMVTDTAKQETPIKAVKTASRKVKSTSFEEEKLIEDILKEFLA